MLNKQIPLIMLTDSLSLFDVITKSTTTNEKPLMIDIKVLEDYYQRKELQTIRFNRSENNPADSLTKVKKCAILDLILAQENLTHPLIL